MLWSFLIKGIHFLKNVMYWKFFNYKGRTAFQWHMQNIHFNWCCQNFVN